MQSVRRPCITRRPRSSTLLFRLVDPLSSFLLGCSLPPLPLSRLIRLERASLENIGAR